MNIKSKGDLGKSELFTREVLNNKDVMMKDGFGKFSSVEKGFEAYLDLLRANYNKAYDALTNDNLSIDDFTKGLQKQGKYGSYATDPTYEAGVKQIFKGVVNDYKKILEYELCREENERTKREIENDLELLKKLR